MPTISGETSLLLKPVFLELLAADFTDIPVCWKLNLIILQIPVFLELLAADFTDIPVCWRSILVWESQLPSHRCLQTRPVVC